MHLKSFNQLSKSDQKGLLFDPGWEHHVGHKLLVPRTRQIHFQPLELAAKVPRGQLAPDRVPRSIVADVPPPRAEQVLEGAEIARRRQGVKVGRVRGRRAGIVGRTIAYKKL